VTARVGIGPSGSGGYRLAVELIVNLPGVDRGLASTLVEQAHQVCPYSNATRGNIELTLTVSGAPSLRADDPPNGAGAAERRPGTAPAGQTGSGSPQDGSPGPVRAGTCGVSRRRSALGG
jgi:hypothetical protein